MTYTKPVGFGKKVRLKEGKMGYYCIAISGRSGCGNTSISRLLAEKLNFKQINYTFRNMAEEMGIPVAEMLEKAKKDKNLDIELDKKQVALSESENSVIASRLAIWLVREKAFTVYLEAPLSIRAKRVAFREGKDFQRAYEETEYRDEQDALRFQRIYNYDISDYSFADYIIDVSKITIPEIVAKIEEEIRSKYLQKIKGKSN